MQPWLDDLSEDWVPQPQSSSPVSTSAVVSSVSHNSGDLTTQSRSRLPRYQPNSGSLASAKPRPIQNDKRIPGKRRSALAERSTNDINVVAPMPLARSESDSVQNQRLSHLSMSSINSVINHGTVEQRPARSSPEKPARNQDTPEWKRRLLKGDMGYGDQRDLFSPMGLENIFQQPSSAPAQNTKKPKNGLRFLDGLDAMPSSPPPWPSRQYGTEQEVDTKPKGLYRENSVCIGKIQLEESQISSRLASASNGGREGHDERREPLSNKLLNPLLDAYKSRLSNSENFPNEGCADQALLETSRTVSGQLELENESFSPVFISKHNTVDGRIDYAALDFSKPEVIEQFRKLGLHEDGGHSAISDTRQAENIEGSSYARFQEDTLPEDLPVGTPDVVDVGGFVTTKRGGYSADGSFQRRPLSPSPRSQLLSDPQTEQSDANSNNQRPDINSDLESGRAGVPPHAPSPPLPVPITPSRRKDSNPANPERTRSSGSPLKLFGDHDTFTSNRLHRRLSQLEDNPQHSQSLEARTLDNGSPRRLSKENRLASVEEVSIQKTHAVEIDVRSNSKAFRSNHSRRETFGQGQLDEYQFPDDLSLLSSAGSLNEDFDSEQSPPASVAPPGSQPQFRFRLDSSPYTRDTFNSKRKPSKNSTMSSVNELSSLDKKDHSSEIAHKMNQIRLENTEGKRPPTSPFKDPTPKRRRTLPAVDAEDGSEAGLESVKDRHAAMQSVLGKKRKDALQDNSHVIADPEVLARRHILRPRNPTPSQRRREEIQAEIFEATEAFMLSSPKLNAIQEHLNSPTAAAGLPEAKQATLVAGEVAAFSLKMSKGMNDESRKRSVTTQDFLDEAVKIMEFIRTKGRPMSGLGSLEESESESASQNDADQAIPSTPLTFSRPPSREGAVGGWRVFRQQELDPRVVSHLRRFQEKDSDEFMASSIHSLRIGRSRDAEKSDKSFVTEQNDIRITENRNRGRSGSDTFHDKFDSIESAPGSNGSHPSGSSFGRTVVTNTSRRSDHVATLAPEAVAHLIPEEVAGMSFDREKGIWVKRRSPEKGSKQFADISATNESEDDPLGNIPDLTVDEIEELAVKQTSRHQTTQSFPQAPSMPSDFKSLERQRPETRDGKTIPSLDTSSAPSKFSNFAWSGPQIETRATSWSGQDVNTSDGEKIQTQLAAHATAILEKDEIEHEIKIHEGRNGMQHSAKTARVRDVTISFSSPCVSRISLTRQRPGDLRENNDISLGYASGEEESFQEGGYGKHRFVSREGHSFGTKTKTAYRGVAWRAASGAKSFGAGVVPPIDENTELSILENSSDPRRMRFSIGVSAPVSGNFQNQDILLPTPPTPCEIADVTFMLSDLPDFTVNQIDECELPNRVIVKRNGSSFSRTVEDRYALGTAALVKALQDVEPDEPFWEDLHEVDLHEKGLTNLHRLDDFCCRVEDLDVSNNSIYQLTGAPSTIRRLNVQNNALTSLTSWGNLMNLQYLDVSRNEIDSLKGFGRLLHLRTLKADHNKINSLEGVLELDGLIHLSVQGNKIEQVDFDFANLKSLVDLNLRGNGLIEARNVQCLPELQHLNLDNNSIRCFPASDLNSTPCRALRSLRLCENGLLTLEIGKDFPNLESLYVDQNPLLEINGLERLKYLRTLSAREQAQDQSLDACSTARILRQHSDIRNLYVSANPLTTFQMPHDFLNLQRLELASSGLQSLPSNFGQLAPNVRFLNLNFNALKDLRPLLNIKRLNELLLAGNRLSRLRKNLAVLSRLVSLTKLDLRDNPLTIGFYPPVVENRIVSVKGRSNPSDEVEPFTLPASNQQTNQQYLARLDEDTRLRRRVHEMLLASSCSSLRELDGLPFDSQNVLVKDEVWERLRFLGIIRRSKQGDKSGEGFESGDETS